MRHIQEEEERPIQSACPLYGFKAGHEILKVVLQCARQDSMLTHEEFNSIINEAERCHIKMLEDNYNEGW